MNNAKKQGLIIIGFGMIILSGIILYFSLSMPKVSLNTSETVNTSEASKENEIITSSFEDTTEDTPEIQNSDNTLVLSAVYPLNLNTCTVEELITLDGIGEKKASDIIEYRNYLGGYTSVEQIKNIKGIGDKVYEKISPYLTV